MRTARRMGASAAVSCAVVFFVVVSLLISPAKSSTTRSAHIALHASWPATSIVAEAVTHVHHTLGATATFDFLRAVAERQAKRLEDGGSSRLSSRDERRLVTAVLEDLRLDSAAEATLNWHLSTRYHSPIIHLHYTVANATLLRFAPYAADATLQRPPISAVVSRAAAAAYLAEEPAHVAQCSAACRTPDDAVATRRAVLAGAVPVVAPACAHRMPDAAEPAVVLLFDPSDARFADWWPAISAEAAKCTTAVSLRFQSPLNELSTPAAPRFPFILPYAAQVTLRSMEYNVVDNRVFKTRLFDDCPLASPADRAVCERRAAARPPVHFVWPNDPTDTANATYTGLQLLQFVRGRVREAGGRSGVDELLPALQLVTEDAPALSRDLSFAAAEYADTVAGKALQKAVRQFRGDFGDRDMAFINGFPFDTATLKQGTQAVFQCLATLSSARHHLAVMGDVTAAAPLLPFGRKPGSPHNIRLSLPLSEKLPSALVWFNDLFADSRYKQWKKLSPDDSGSVKLFVEAVERHSGMDLPENSEHLRLVNFKAHHLSLILFVDPGNSEQFPYLSFPESIVHAKLPLHVGVVLVPRSRISKLIAAGFQYFLRLKGRKTAVMLLSMVRQIMEYLGGGYRQVPITEQLVEMAFQQVAKDLGGEYSSAAQVLSDDEDVKGALKEATDFAEEMKLFTEVDADDRESENPEDARRFQMVCLLNGIVIKDVQRDIIPLVIKEQERVAQLLQGGVFAGRSAQNLSDDEWVSADSNLIAVKRLSSEMKTQDIGSGGPRREGPVSAMRGKDIFALGDSLKEMLYESNESVSLQPTVTVWLASTDHTSETFRRVSSFVRELAGSDFAVRTKARFAIIPPESAVQHSVVHSVPGDIASEGVVVINGRRVVASGIESAEDLLVEVASEHAVQRISFEGDGDSRLLYAVYERESDGACTAERSDSRVDSSIFLQDILRSAQKADLSPLIYTKGGDGLEAAASKLSIVCVIDPQNPNAHVSTALVEALSKTYSEDDLHLAVILASSSRNLKAHADQPKTFRKFLLSDGSGLDDNLQQQMSPRLSFDRLPQRAVLTFSVEPPRAWFMSSYATNYDMDNVILDRLEDGTHDLYTDYQLRNLIVEGSCIDEKETPPQGLKIVLENESGISVDTLVMSNLGYFQFKVPTPGLWKLLLAPGASSKIFSLKSMETFKQGIRSTYEVDETGRVAVPVESLSGAGGILLRVTRNAGMEKMSVLDPNGAHGSGENEGMVGALKSKFSKFYAVKNEQKSSPSKPRTIHVFSVASGLLYERFLKIMISSVTKHASRPVKFWLLENYLSPSFKKLLPVFAKRHGAEVGMVTYRWPGWLREQTEKQRIIWAYKILFLDVLFPLDVERIIFVDSDQVLRGDLAELMDIDLKGAPYGYVPFCDSRKEVEGYRFWKTGFWKDTLGKAKYRISALYVVDLNRFRETAAGDTLRFVYQQLSADPNSLSNLDQDLPNYASVAGATGRAVPIFDLPQEWLWCESWCDDESKKAAKAIDLCNNPMTKEPKLESAKRIIAEWVDYDNAASELTESIYEDLVEAESGTSSQDETDASGEDIMKTEL